MSAKQTNRFERDACAYHALVVVDVWDDRQECLADGLDQDARKRGHFREDERKVTFAQCGIMVRGGNYTRAGQRRASCAFLEDLARRFCCSEVEL